MNCEADKNTTADGDLIVAVTTVSDIEKAKSLAHQVVAQHLVACCNIVPGITSIYHWQGELCNDQECLLVMKTVKNRFIELDQWVRTNHPYEVPELLAIPVTACLKEYLSWVVKETA